MTNTAVNVCIHCTHRAIHSNSSIKVVHVLHIVNQPYKAHTSDKAHTAHSSDGLSSQYCMYNVYILHFIRVHVHVRVYMYMYVCTCSITIRMCVCVYMYSVHVYMYMYIRTNMCVCVCVCVSHCVLWCRLQCIVEDFNGKTYPIYLDVMPFHTVEYLKSVVSVIGASWRVIHCR